MEGQRTQPPDYRRGHNEAGGPIVVRGHPRPWSIPCPRIFGGVLISSHVVVPILALFDVTGGKLPVFFRLLDPFEKPFFLLLLGDVEKELANDNAITSKISLEVPDVLEALLPNVLRHQLRRQF